MGDSDTPKEVVSFQKLTLVLKVNITGQLNNMVPL